MDVAVKVTNYDKEVAPSCMRTRLSQSVQLANNRPLRAAAGIDNGLKQVLPAVSPPKAFDAFGE